MDRCVVVWNARGNTGYGWWRRWWLIWLFWPGLWWIIGIRRHKRRRIRGWQRFQQTWLTGTMWCRWGCRWGFIFIRRGWWCLERERWRIWLMRWWNRRRRFSGKGIIYWVLMARKSGIQVRQWVWFRPVKEICLTLKYWERGIKSACRWNRWRLQKTFIRSVYGFGTIHRE